MKVTKINVIKAHANYEVNVFGITRIVKGSTLATMIRNAGKLNYKEVKNA